MYDGNHGTLRSSRVKANNGDVISVDLDADAWTLSFRKNDSKAIGTINIKRGEYRIAITMLHERDSLKFV